MIFTLKIKVYEIFVLKTHRSRDCDLIKRVKYIGGSLTCRPVPLWSTNLQTRKSAP